MSRRKTTASTGDGKKGYEVGYGKPPTHTRFRPGQSGYPAGRRKGVRNLKTDVQAHAGDAGQGEGGRPHAHEINAGSGPHGVAREGAQGDARAFERLLELALRFNNDEAETGRRQLPADDQAILAAYVAELAGAAMTAATGSAADDPASKPRRRLRHEGAANERAGRSCRAAAQRPALFHPEELPDHIAGHTLSAELAYRRHRPPVDACARRRDLPAPDQPAAALPEIDLRVGCLCGMAAGSRSDPPRSSW